MVNIRKPAISIKTIYHNGGAIVDYLGKIGEGALIIKNIGGLRTKRLE